MASSDLQGDARAAEEVGLKLGSFRGVVERVCGRELGDAEPSLLLGRSPQLGLARPAMLGLIGADDGFFFFLLLLRDVSASIPSSCTGFAFSFSTFSTFFRISFFCSSSTGSCRLRPQLQVLWIHWVTSFTPCRAKTVYFKQHLVHPVPIRPHATSLLAVSPCFSVVPTAGALTPIRKRD